MPDFTRDLHPQGEKKKQERWQFLLHGHNKLPQTMRMTSPVSRAFKDM
jgi:hypothetical protein